MGKIRNQPSSPSRSRGTTYSERSELQRRRAPGVESRTLDARQAVEERMSLGPPVPQIGYHGVRMVMLQYEPGIVFLGELGWTPQKVWDAVMGGGRPRDTITASVVVAIIHLSWFSLECYGRVPRVDASPTWIDGERTALGAKFDEEMPGLNIQFWQAGLDSKQRRRYSESHGRHSESSRADIRQRRIARSRTR